MHSMAWVAKRMIDMCEGSLKDITHLLKVHSLALLIGQLEELDRETLDILEVAALTHDIACPSCRRIYGGTDWPLQEREGEAMARKLLEEEGFPQPLTERVAYLVGHHHQWDKVDGPDYQILLEADFLVNAEEQGISPEKARRVGEKMFRTISGLALLLSLFPLAGEAAPG